MSSDDHYLVLGISEKAGPDEVKSAFRKKSLEAHPDRNPDDPNANGRFRRVVEAHRVLSDPNLRMAYDRSRRGPPDGLPFIRTGGIPKAEPNPTMQDVVNSLFNDIQSRGPETFSEETSEPIPREAPRQEDGSRRGRESRETVWITLEQAAMGGPMETQVPASAPCGRCSGSASEPGTPRMPCMACSGTGELLRGTSVRVCGNCRGRRFVAVKPCSKCEGTGIQSITRNIRFRIPPGIEDGMELRVAGMGGPGPGGPGDLYVTVRLREHPEVSREGRDLRVTVEVSLKVAMIGGTVPVPYLGRTVDVEVPPGAALRGEEVLVEGAGIRSALGRRAGDLRVSIKTRFPSILSARARKLIEELDEEISRR